MGRIILHHDGRYAIYSTISDKIDVWDMSEADLREHLIEEALEEARREMEPRIARAAERGSSEYNASLATTVLCNRAGCNETRLTVEQIIDAFFVNPVDPKKLPNGRDPYEEGDDI